MNVTDPDSLDPGSSGIRGEHRFRAVRLGDADIALPRIASPDVLWQPICFWVWALFAFLLLNAVPAYFVQYWFNQSLGYKTIFWTNVSMQLSLFVVYATAVTIAVALPVNLHAGNPTVRRASLHMGAWIGIIGGWLFAQDYLQFLLAFHGVPFEEFDPVFGNDIGFYVYQLPTLQVTLFALEAIFALATASLLVARYAELKERGVFRRTPAVSAAAQLFASSSLQVLVYLFGGVVTVQTFLGRYGLLVRSNESSGVRAGADYLDLVGTWSSLNGIYVAMFVQIGLTLVVGAILYRVKQQSEMRARVTTDVGTPSVLAPRHSFRGLLTVGLLLICLRLTFFVGLRVKDFVFVSPNEPYIQQEYITRHIAATIKAYGLDQVTTCEWIPPDEPLSPSALLTSKTIQNAPILPSWVSYLEEPPDVQHFERINVSDSSMVFGPMLQIYEQQQQLRPYYQFLSVDGVRYTVDEQKQMFVSAVRELPSVAMVGESEWMKYWGSSALLYTHGMGIVMSPVNRVDAVGSPEYASKDIPPDVTDEALEHEPRIYFGEGARDDYVLTNVRQVKEFDYATAQARQENVYPEGLTDGIHINSLFRRAIFALYTKDVTAFLFSRYIDPTKTRIHLRRTPLARAQSIAPFLFFDSNTFAFISDKRVLWMVNALTTTDRYPYSFPEVLGDKADERAIESFPERVINYGEDSVKVTVDAYSGEVRFYKIADDPIVNSWQQIYPDLFEPEATMPAPVEAQLTYPLQWLHIQFDDIYKRYHQHDPIEFYNVEDLWDDADETVGSIGRGLSGFGTGDQMTFSYEGYNVLLDPADLPPGIDVGVDGKLQYTMLLPFTPEGCRNLRALIMAFQDPGSYGKLVSFQIPQGMFVPGPEQVDAYIDNDRPVHQQVTMWIRHGSEVIRGSTLLLPVGGDIAYIETIWVSSLQNELPQLKLVALHYQGRITSGTTLDEAIRERGSGVHDSAADTGERQFVTVSIAVKSVERTADIDAASEVTIHSSKAFDAATVEVASVRFGVTGAEAAPLRAVLKDGDRDGDVDMMLLFRTQETGIRAGATSAILTGRTSAGREFRASAPIRAGKT